MGRHAIITPESLQEKSLRVKALALNLEANKRDAIINEITTRAETLKSRNGFAADIDACMERRKP